MPGVAPGVTPEEATAAWANMATRPPEESGKPRVVDGPPCTRTSTECTATRLEKSQAVSELGKAKTEIENLGAQLVEANTKLMVSSGVTAAGRNEELLLKLQRIHTGMQNNIENLEAEVGHLRKQIRFLENIIQNEGFIYDVSEWTEFEAPVKDNEKLERTWAELTGGDGSQL